jgi:hypothetical protein
MTSMLFVSAMDTSCFSVRFRYNHPTAQLGRLLPHLDQAHSSVLCISCPAIACPHIADFSMDGLDIDSMIQHATLALSIDSRSTRCTHGIAVAGELLALDYLTTGRVLPAQTLEDRTKLVIITLK